MYSVGGINLFLSGYELIHHRVTQSFTEFNQFEIKRIELRETLCYSVVNSFITRNNESFTLLGLKHLSIHYV